MKPIPPMSAASAYTSSIPVAAARQSSQRLKSTSLNSSAALAQNSHANHFTCVCIVDQLQKDAPDKLTYWVKERGVRGLRFITIAEEVVMIDDPRTFPLWERAV